MEPVLADLRYLRSAAPADDRAGAVRGSDRGFLVLIPDQRPAQRFAPEGTDLPRPVAGQRAEPSTAGEERILRLDETELVAFGVGQHDVRLVRSLADVDVAGSQRNQSGH